MFKKILIANRGEIAVRIMRTCREMGIGTVAVYSEVDADAAHVIEADEAYLLGKSEPSESYLNKKKLIESAKKAGAEAIHPGYGFLAENPEFAQDCEESGITFIGPPAQVIRRLGSKTLARRMMARAGVPVIPGMLEATTHVPLLIGEAQALGYPVLVKAVAGGGGKGMRVVSSEKDMEEACLSAMSESGKAFGDGSLFLRNASKPLDMWNFRFLQIIRATCCISSKESAPSRGDTKKSSKKPPPLPSPHLFGRPWERRRSPSPRHRAMSTRARWSFCWIHKGPSTFWK